MSQSTKPKKGYKNVPWLFHKEIEIPKTWKVIDLKVISELQNGFAFKSKDYVEKGIQILKISNVSHGYFDWDEESFVPNKYWNDYSDFQIKKGDIILAMTRPIISGGLKTAIFNETKNFLLNQRVGKFLLTNVNDYFFFSLINQKSVIDQLSSKMGESGQPNISSPEFGEIKIIYTEDITEQEKIVSILSNIDELFVMTQKIIDDATLVKKVLIQELLTKGFGDKKSKNVPWLFHKDLSMPEDWDVKEINDDVFEYLISGTNARSDLNENGEIGYIHYGDIHTKWNTVLDCDTEAIPRIDKEKVASLPLLKDGDLIIVDASEDVEGSGTSVLLKNVKNKKIVAGLHTIALRLKDESISPDFLKYLTSIHSVKMQIISFVHGSKVFGLGKTICKSIQVPFPKLPEQEKIVSILSNVDEQIIFQTKYQKKLKILKKSLIQKLLSGEIRVK